MIPIRCRWTKSIRPRQPARRDAGQGFGTSSSGSSVCYAVRRIEAREVEADRAYDRNWFRWQVGRPTAAAIIAQAERLLDARRNTRCLMLVQESIGKADLRGHREELLVLRARALMALGSAVRALEAVDEALAGRADHRAAIQLRDLISSRP